MLSTFKHTIYSLQVFDSAEELKSKVRELAVAVKQASHLVVYTGAGISTVHQTLLSGFPYFCLVHDWWWLWFQAASIPDYRGPNGVWTQLQKGRTVWWDTCIEFWLWWSFSTAKILTLVFPNSSSDLSKAEPTLTHMCIRMLHKEKLVCKRLAVGPSFILYTVWHYPIYTGKTCCFTKLWWTSFAQWSAQASSVWATWKHVYRGRKQSVYFFYTVSSAKSLNITSMKKNQITVI